VKVVVVFDGQGARVSETAESHGVQIFYSRRGQTADAIIERLTSKYANRFEVTVATSDVLECQTVIAFGASCISPKGLRQLVESARLN